MHKPNKPNLFTRAIHAVRDAIKTGPKPPTCHQCHGRNMVLLSEHTLVPITKPTTTVGGVILSRTWRCRDCGAEGVTITRAAHPESPDNEYGVAILDPADGFEDIQRDWHW